MSDTAPPITASDLDEALRFVHLQEAQGRDELRYAAVEISALVDLLVAKGVISARELEERRARARREQDAREERILFARVNGTADKYQLESPPVPCGELLPVCKGACCRLRFNLSTQDLDEGVVRWSYARPYAIRQRADGYCVHHGGRDGCQVYAQRPAVCRGYDCRADKRIWESYEARVTSEAVARLPPLGA